MCVDFQHIFIFLYLIIDWDVNM